MRRCLDLVLQTSEGSVSLPTAFMIAVKNAATLLAQGGNDMWMAIYIWNDDPRSDPNADLVPLVREYRKFGL
jgi:hypothetical protein